ncbi:hypothetical protein WJX84_010474 [Apatococcus fuscideae]|uniref:SCP2 domain-containing protein n=1 Tax=Apatococcus fuscideae TaxID=2026836 RepID=A0AAW1T576_9CHLO
MGKAKGSAPLFEQLSTSLKTEGEDLVSRVKGLILFKIDGEEWTLDLRPETGTGSISKGPAPKGFKPDLTLTISDDNFVKLVAGKIGPQQAFLMRKLKIGGSMAMAMKLQPILDAAAPKSKL